MNLPEVIWADTLVLHQENLFVYSQLIQYFKVTRFQSYIEAAQYIQNTNNQYLVITSGKNGKEFVDLIQGLGNVTSIVVFCCNIAYHSTWAGNYNKVVEITDNYLKVIDSLIAI